VATILTLAQHGFFGVAEGVVNISYVADTVILFRYYEEKGVVKQALSVVKKRTGNHERSIRELRFGPDGLHIGAPLTGFRGILSGNAVGGEQPPGDDPAGDE
jgi:circadian clock protein KaiC